MNLVEEELVPAARRLSDLLFRPSRAFREIRGEPLVQAVIWYGVLLPASLLLAAVVALVYFGLRDPMRPGLYSSLGMGDFITLVVFLFLWLTAGTLVFGIFYHLLVLVCGGREGIRRTLAVVLYAATPGLLLLWIAESLWLYGMYPASGLLFLISLLWGVILAVIGIREAHGLTTARAVIPPVLLFLILAAAFLLLLFQPLGDQCGGCSRITIATAACTGENITLTYQGGQDAEYVINISAYDTDPSGTLVMGGTDGILPIGSVLMLPAPLYSPANPVAIASYTDGTKQVILDQKMKCGEGPGKTRPATTAPSSSPTTRPVPSARTSAPSLAGTVTPSMTMIATPSLTVTTTTARAATPAPTGIGRAGLEAEYPVRATALSTNQVGKLSFTLRTGTGDLPLGAG
jgi:hypothetical protein